MKKLISALLLVGTLASVTLASVTHAAEVVYQDCQILDESKFDFWSRTDKFVVMGVNSEGDLNQVAKYKNSYTLCTICSEGYLARIKRRTLEKKFEFRKIVSESCQNAEAVLKSLDM